MKINVRIAFEGETLEAMKGKFVIEGEKYMEIGTLDIVPAELTETLQALIEKEQKKSNSTSKSTPKSETTTKDEIEEVEETKTQPEPKDVENAEPKEEVETKEVESKTEPEPKKELTELEIMEKELSPLGITLEVKDEFVKANGVNALNIEKVSEFGFKFYPKKSCWVKKMAKLEVMRNA
jgi:outer membrane biosynthesis protein TonB